MTPACPRCTTASLHRSHAHGVWVLACTTCHGLWIDRDACGSLLGKIAAEAHAEAHLFDAACPICRHPMERITVREIALERCVAHGLWFDHQELDHIVHARTTSTAPSPSSRRRSDAVDTTVDVVVVTTEVVSNTDTIADMVGAVFDWLS